MICSVTKNDREAFISLLEEFYSTPAVHIRVPRSYFERTFREVTSGSPYAHAYLFKKDGKTAGYGQVSLTYSTEAGGLVVLLEEIYVRPEFQGMGLGREYFAFIRERYKNAARIRLEVDADNAGAIRLYKSQGLDFMTYLQMYADFPREE